MNLFVEVLTPSPLCSGGREDDITEEEGMVFNS